MCNLGVFTIFDGRGKKSRMRKMKGMRGFRKKQTMFLQQAAAAEALY